MRLIMGFALTCLLTNAVALTVIADTGNTTDVQDYLIAANTGKNNSLSQPRQDFQTIGIPAHSQISPGEVSAYRIDAARGIPQAPFFVVGDDAISKDWLVKNAGFLKEQGALGFVTNIESEARFKEIAALVDVSLLPVNVDVFTEALGVNHYPFFTDGKELWQ